MATFFAMKQFSHYLLRCPFTIMLTLHHYTVVVSTRNGGVFVSGLWPYKNTHLLLYIHHKGTLMPPTRFTQVPVAITSTTEYTIDLQQAQIEYPALQHIQQALSKSHEKPIIATWHCSSLRQYSTFSCGIIYPL